LEAHKQTYSRKGNSKSRSVSDIADEAERLDGACPHVGNPQPPTILEGMRPSEVVALIEQRIAEQNKLLRRLRKEQPERKEALRGIRSDTHVMIGSVFSFPDPVEDMNEAEYLRWRRDVITFARDDAARNGAEVLSIVEHLDEAHPHVHVLAVPLCADDNMRMDAKRCHESFRAQTEHAQKGWSGSPSRSYKQAMSRWQDRYHAAVGSKHSGPDGAAPPPSGPACVEGRAGAAEGAEGRRDCRRTCRTSPSPCRRGRAPPRPGHAGHGRQPASGGRDGPCHRHRRVDRGHPAGRSRPGAD
jgi:hypothetical protein